MSKFNSYARELDKIAKAAFVEYRNADAIYQKARQQAEKYPQRTGWTDPDYAAKSARAQADFIEAKETFRRAQTAFSDRKKEIATIRNQLATAIDDEYSADPEKLDTATLELLKSGTLRCAEYRKLMNKALEADNHTMVRLIGHYADTAATEAVKRNGDTDRTAQELRTIASEGKHHDGGEYLQAFDSMVTVFDRTTHNDALIDRWDSLTAQVVENF